MGRRYIKSDSLPDTSDASYTHAIVTGDTLHMSGQVGMDADRELAGTDVASQARQAFANVETILAELDRDLGDVVKVTAYVVDPQSRFEKYADVWDETFDEPYPCHTVIGVDQLAGEQYLIEIEVEADLGN